MLANGNVGDTKSVSFTWQYLGQDKDLGTRIFNEATTFELIDDGFAIGEEPEKVTSVEENTEEGEDYDAITEEPSTVTNTVDYDKWIDEYEAYFNELSKYYKKIKNGDQSAYANYAKALQKFNSLTDKLHGAENEMTPAQMKRVSRVIQKFSQEMQQ